MNATEHMLYMAQLDIDLETTLAVMRVSGHSEDEITLALNSMPRSVLDNWRDTLRLVSMPRGKKKF